MQFERVSVVSRLLTLSLASSLKGSIEFTLFSKKSSNPYHWEEGDIRKNFTGIGLQVKFGERQSNGVH